VLDPAVVARAQAKREQGEDLSDLEMSQLMHRQHLNFRIFETAHSQYLRGALDESEWHRYEEIIEIQLSDNEYARQMWRVYRVGFREDFRLSVDAVFEQVSGELEP
jgi:hypothetical protein